MRIIYNVRHCYARLLKFGDKVLASLTKYVLKPKASICSESKKMYVYIVISFQHLSLQPRPNIFLQQVLYHKETPFKTEKINFTIESLASHLRSKTFMIQLYLWFYTHLFLKLHNETPLLSCNKFVNIEMLELNTFLRIGQPCFKSQSPFKAF